MHTVIKSWLKLKGKELNDLYKNSSAGNIPQGITYGTGIVPTGTFITKILAFIVKVFLWQGKTFFKENGNNKLINRLTPLRLQLVKADVYKAASWLDNKETIVLDYSKSFIAKPIHDEIREIEPGVYLGKVWFCKIPIVYFALEI